MHGFKRTVFCQVFKVLIIHFSFNLLNVFDLNLIESGFFFLKQRQLDSTEAYPNTQEHERKIG